MSITDELRHNIKGAEQLYGRECKRLTAIADRIDAEHEKSVVDALLNDGLPMSDEVMAELGWIRLPVDADGVPIHVGDVMDYLEALHTDVPARFKVQDMFYFGKGEWRLRAYPATYEPEKCRHYHALTVEDVLIEFGEWYAHTKGGCDEDGIIAEYAAKLQLREDA